ncbi:hypothetical protein VC82_2422 [Flagellimonas lutaonensis]|uniref:Uncharacterized protein n=1 Tax=Flagellimonas lutaonensis TaxID=516051 RepID=A0A0D5YVS0_9FLAO|nr:hypothetical protein VC82_2422 [Allomuricauda lutaonensis]
MIVNLFSNFFRSYSLVLKSCFLASLGLNRYFEFIRKKLLVPILQSILFARQVEKSEFNFTRIGFIELTLNIFFSNSVSSSERFDSVHKFKFLIFNSNES